MTEQSPAEAIFLAALEHDTDDERITYVNDACGEDSNLRQRVLRLLAAHPKVGNFMEPSPALAPAESSPVMSGPAETVTQLGPTEGVGSVIAGRYKLLETLGQGGMGTVFMAQQTEPVKRLVALKLIKPGMDSRQILARFEAERQALALMDHPNIAKVLDAGATESGRPFFVMELVKGVAMTRFCDERQLSLRERLELFIPVCHAIQHAHQKGVIHRDIKPTNVLVCLYDDRPVPKVIDFGVAKAAGSKLTDASLVTGFGAIVGTPEYLSPEQAQLNQIDIDTRSDVYALGVLLYELLTGTTPIDRKRPGQGALLEILRVIREEEPARPSARLSSSETLASIAATRRTEPARLTRLARGELDWIVMKCLEKERSRRYETANALARDLERYLHGDVVEARSPSAGYRVRKFIRKHRVGISTVLAFVGLLIAAAGISAVLAVKARRAEAVARDEGLVAEANAKLAKRNSDAYHALLEQSLEDRVEAELRGLSLQVDLDLSELRDDRRLGLLRLARPMDPNRLSIQGSTITPDLPTYKMTVTVGLEQYPRYKQLREFITMAVLACGQASAPLLRPISHDGEAVHTYFLSSSGSRLVTLGDDRTARLWDPVTGRQIAILRRGTERAIETGLSPDGAAAFTNSLDGVVRLWETKDGAFRTTLEPTRAPIQPSDHRPVDPAQSRFLRGTETLLSNDRVLTFMNSLNRDSESRHSARRALCELWDAKTGQSIARLALPQLEHLDLQFVGSGRWIKVHDADRKDQTLHLFSAENGHAIAQLKYGRLSLFHDFVTNVGPGGNSAASLYTDLRPNGGYSVGLWDTSSWKLTSVTELLRGSWDDVPHIHLIADDLFAIYEGSLGIIRTYRPATSVPVAEFSGSPNAFRGGQVVLDSGQIFDVRTGARLHPPKGRKYHSDLTRFAPDGRFLASGIDTVTEKAIPAMGLMGSHIDEPKNGWVAVDRVWDSPQLPLRRLPPPDRLNIPSCLLELWAQVAMRGQIDDEGRFVKWDEPTWEKKRQELAAAPTPYPDFPFPGHLAVDRIYWMRQEFENANDADIAGKRRLAQELLDRANLVGDKAEAVRWVAVLAGNLVDSLITAPLLRADVEDRLRQDASLSAEVRSAALSKAAQLVEDSSDLNRASWSIAARSNAEKDEYRRALRWAEAAVRNRPENSTFVSTLGVLQYRNGLYTEAIATLMRSHEANRNSETGPEPSDPAFLAMAHHALGESDKAREYLRQLTGLCEQPAWKANKEAAGFLNEARQRLATPP
jgi:Protein kinase domain